MTEFLLVVVMVLLALVVLLVVALWTDGGEQVELLDAVAELASRVRQLEDEQ